VGYELEQDLARYPEERGEISLEAAAQWRRAGEANRATALLEELLALGGEDAADARHGLAELCFDRGADADAWAHLEVLERGEPSGTGPAGLVAELLEERGEYEAALRWFDLAIGAENAAQIAAEPTADRWFTVIPLFGRQRCRTRLGLPVDELDRAADAAERNRTDVADKAPPGRCTGERPWRGTETGSDRDAHLAAG
jgi:tetratricopeptide (TPR) repeat protein